jgi:hypothetical protein
MNRKLWLTGRPPNLMNIKKKKMASESHFKTIQQLTCFVKNNRVKSTFFTSNIVLTGVSRVLFMSASKNNLKLKNIFS